MAPDQGIGTAGPDPGPADRGQAPAMPRPIGGDRDASSLLDRFELILGRIDRLRDRPNLALAVAALVGVMIAAIWWLARPGSVAPVEAGIPMATSTTATGSPAGQQDSDRAPAVEVREPMVVHVAGAVEKPGIVTLDPGSRIGDAVEAAGGPTADADVHQLNLAAPVVDGLQVRVPIEGEVVSPTGTSSNPGDAEGPVAVNTATEADLEELPGIGPSLAAAIVEWRSANGPFGAIDDLLAVPGIGPAKLAGFADRVTL